MAKTTTAMRSSNKVDPPARRGSLTSISRCCAARRSRNATLPLLHRMEERAGERRWPPLSSILSPLLRLGARKKNPRRSELARPATIWTDNDRRLQSLARQGTGAVKRCRPAMRLKICNAFSLTLLIRASTDMLAQPSNLSRTTNSPPPLLRAHAHNDYEHPRPLLDALDHGFCSIEADIYLVENKLLVAHDRDQAKPERTLQALYLDPLRERARKNGGRVYPNGPEMVLLVD